jgi:RimJ/RimL family protein N-acetyltransferase
MFMPTQPVTVRPLVPLDADAIRGLSAETDFGAGSTTFPRPRPRDLAKVAASLARADRGHGAVGAFTGRRLVGVANYVDLHVARSAEIAMVLAPDHDRRSTGTALLDRLVRLAGGNGIERFLVDMLADNAAMMRLMLDAQWPVTSCQRDGMPHVGVHIDRLPLRCG